MSRAHDLRKEIKGFGEYIIRANVCGEAMATLMKNQKVERRSGLPATRQDKRGMYP
jgi:hypothetical protein